MQISSVTTEVPGVDRRLPALDGYARCAWCTAMAQRRAGEAKDDCRYQAHALIEPKARPVSSIGQSMTRLADPSRSSVDADLSLRTRTIPGFLLQNQIGGLA